VDAEFIRDLFQPLGLVTVRRMFGGAGLFADGVMFGLVSDGQIYLKVDAATVTCFERECCGPFEYSTKNGNSRPELPKRRSISCAYDAPVIIWSRAHNAITTTNHQLATQRE
jgi:DNA transformation protein